MAAGLDSLGAVELRNALEARLALRLPATLVFDHPTAAAIAALAAAASVPAAVIGGADDSSDYDDVSDDEGPEARLDAAAAAAGSFEDPEAVRRIVLSEVSSILGRAIDGDAPLMAAGLDSLAAVELRGALEARFGLPLPATLAVDYPTAAAVAALVAGRLAAAAAPGKRGAFSRPACRAHGMPRGNVLHTPATAVLAAPIGVLGFASRAPGQPGGGLHVDAVTPVPLDRWAPDAYAWMLGSDVPPPRFGAFLGPAAALRFDAAAFGLSDSEAALIDPQQWLLLEAYHEASLGAALAAGGAWKGALMTGGRGGAVAGGANVGVYVGISAVDFSKLVTRLASPVTAYSATGGLSLSVAAGRVSYTFGLTGPALAVDTACSSSLAAAHAAAGGLRLGQCGAAAAGGVNLTLIPDTPAMFQKAGESFQRRL